MVSKRARMALALWALVGGLGSTAKAAPGGTTSTEVRSISPDGETASTSTAVPDAFAIVPEPGVLVLLGIGLTAVGVASRRKKR